MEKKGQEASQGPPSAHKVNIPQKRARVCCNPPEAANAPDSHKIPAISTGEVLRKAIRTMEGGTDGGISIKAVMLQEAARLVIALILDGILMKWLLALE